MSESKQAGESFEKVLRSKTSELVSSIEEGKLADAVNLLHVINEARNQDLYQQIGQLTRALHNAITEFHLDTQAAITEQSQRQGVSEITDAKDRLNYIINLTQNAANRTMDKVDESLPLTQQIGEEAAVLHYEWGRLKRREMKPDEFRNLYQRIDKFLIHTQESTQQVNSNFSEIILAQDYQDLTGQVVKKVITLVHDIEASLVRLVKMASDIDTITGINNFDAETTTQVNNQEILPEGPVINAEERGIEVVSGQDEVDDLLSSLGF